jgi:hypothetical protein
MHEEIFQKLIKYCSNEDWQGYDPYDGLNNLFYRFMPDWKYLRIACIQFFKRSPFNLRPLLGIKKGENPKGLALFARAFLLAYRHTQVEKYYQYAQELLERLCALHSKGYGARMCWGYNFDWQSRAFFVPQGTPSIVCTTFVAHAWLDHYELFKDSNSLEIATAACEFLLQDLNRNEISDQEFCFSYTPLDQSEVHNANLLGAELLARVGELKEDDQLKALAIRSARFSVNRQAADGSWFYGTAAFQQWIDSFHTGFNLVSLARVIKDCGMVQWQDVLLRGWEFYIRHFFLADATPKYYHNKIYPIDIHAAAQAIVTFARLKHLSSDANGQIDRLLGWVLTHMWDERGFFYFQQWPRFTNKIPYMRWSQAWMVYALAMAIYDQP